MSVVSVLQLIEKKKQRGNPKDFWRSTANNEHQADEHLSDVFENCFIRTATNNWPVSLSNKSVSESIITSGHLAHDLDLATDTNEDTDKDGNEILSSLKGDALIALMDSVDEVDYFDSEDEYWENLREESIKSNFCMRCKLYHPPHNFIGTLENEYIKSPLITPLVEKFAKENNFEIKDVYGDGNCLFRAVADQLMINGCPGHTEVSLRETALSFLKNNPAKYGVHTSSFLTGETWEDYLCRMEISGEWGDHIILQALAECFLLHVCVYNVANNDIRKTEVAAKTKVGASIKFNIILCYVGQSHYFSLRSLNWRMELPYKSQIHRILLVCSDKTSYERRKLVDSKLAFMSQGVSANSYLADSAQFVLQCISLKENAERLNPNKPIDFEHIFMSYSGSFLHLEETEDTRTHLIKDQDLIDSISGIPLAYLSFILKHIAPFKMFQKKFIIPHPWYKLFGRVFHYLGSVEDESAVILKDISWTQKASSTMKDKIARIVVFKENKDAVFDTNVETGEPFLDHLFVDCSDTQPGYCRLRLPSSFPCKNNDQFVKIGSSMYQKAFSIPDTLEFEINVGFKKRIQYIGVLCQTFPFIPRWKKKKRCDFPSEELIKKINQTGCTLIPKSHGTSLLPDIEWQFNFSMSEHLIFKSLTNAQLHGFYVLKSMIECMVQYLPFKTKHLKSVFFMVCEEIPSRIWETNFSACVLNVLGSLLSCFKARFLPNYFMPKRNLIDTIREEDLNSLCIICEYIREFPADVIKMVGEKHGFKYAPNLIKSVLCDAKSYSKTKNMSVAFCDLLLPHSISTAKVMAKMGFYETAFDILEDAFEQSLLVSHTEVKHANSNFPDFFMSAIRNIKQKSSKIILSRILQTQMGTNISKMNGNTEKDCLQTHLPWKLDQNLNWLKYPTENSRDLTEIAHFLYEFSKKELYKRNWLLADSSITTAIRCVKELLKESSFHLESMEDTGLKNEVENQTRIVKLNLIQYYKHAWYVSRLYRGLYPLIEYMDDIENMCKEFPEIAHLVSLMYHYLGQFDKSREYARISNVHLSRLVIH